MFSHFGFGTDDLRGFMINGIDGAWVDETTRATWRAQWLPEFDSLVEQLP
jgi:adenosine deaminase